MSNGCWNCGAAKVEGRLNCFRCGRVYRDAPDRYFERNPAKHRFEGGTGGKR
ncbi:MAG TPA: hypothetical protein VE174_09565 [Actinomycetota bacterium]|nr:hypothetical protein [Actinomycetota bacterium]